ncbi:Rv1733c family protein [Amycolatopsis lexingtonensis]|uniref:Rv1733c family protein n=1 Tax=Amycolatopsis lexingtonensis TaxID=218822 RepID=UPI003F6F83B7
MRRPSGRIARFRRRLHPGRNPLARTGDRFESLLLLLVIAGAFLAVPFAAAFGSDTYAAQTVRAEQERATRHPATAVSLASAPSQPYSTDGAGAPADQTTVQAAWFDARGARHTGDVLADAGSPAGTRVSVWLDQHGELTTEPLSPATSAADGVFAAILLWVAITGSLAGLYGAGRFVVSRLHSAAWDRAWAEARHDSRF